MVHLEGVHLLLLGEPHQLTSLAHEEGYITDITLPTLHINYSALAVVTPLLQKIDQLLFVGACMWEAVS